ncbi:hypothetical protein EG68_11524, partial [Paragonimus skrjabini miyazakii]
FYTADYELFASDYTISLYLLSSRQGLHLAQRVVMNRPLSELNMNVEGGSECFIRTERSSTNSTLSKINNLFHKNLVNTEDLDLEIMRMSPDHPLHSVNSFQNMNLSLSLLKGICSLGFYKPSMIQEKTLPLLVSTKRLPSTCQILLFSATFDDEVVEFAREFVPDPIEIRVKRTQLPLKNIRQFHLRFNDWTDKYQALTDIYGGFDVGQAIIFCATRKEASWLEGRLNGDGHRVTILSGELDVKEREAVIEKFRSAQYRVLITTNVCARGLDIPQVNLVINWNMPLTCSGSADCETYLHRIGRSGRFGKNGVAVNFITDEELDVLRELEVYFDIKIPALTMEDLQDV